MGRTILFLQQSLKLNNGLYDSLDNADNFFRLARVLWWLYLCGLYRETGHTL